MYPITVLHPFLQDLCNAGSCYCYLVRFPEECCLIPHHCKHTNFDETEKEPAVLPSRFPNLLVNGTQGIAVGMATNIPPHNLREVINAVIKIIDNQVEEDRETTIEELLEIIKGPDFPTGAHLRCGLSGPLFNSIIA